MANLAFLAELAALGGEVPPAGDDALAADGGRGGPPSEDDERQGAVVEAGVLANANILDAGALVGVARRRRQTEAARTARAAKRQQLATTTSASHEPAAKRRFTSKAPNAIALACDPRLGVLDLGKKLSAQNMWALVRLAFAQRVRGVVAETLRRQQRRGAVLLSLVVDDLQPRALAMWLAAPEGPRHRQIVGMTIMWDETTQRMRALVEGMVGRQEEHTPQQKLKVTSMPVGVQVMATLVTMYRCRCDDGDGDVVPEARDGGGDGNTCWSRQPWVTKPMYLHAQNAETIFEGLYRNSPLKLDKPESIAMVDNSLVILCYGYDSAKSNLVVMSYIAEQSMLHLPEHVIVHGEPCASHQVAIMKGSAIETAGFASIIYSASKLLRLSSSINGLRTGIAQIVKEGFEVEHAYVPDDGGQFLPMAMAVLCIDEDSSLLQKFGRDRKLARTQLYEDLSSLDRMCRLDLQRGKWTYYLWGSGSAQNPDADEDGLPPLDYNFQELVDKVVVPVLNVFTAKAWPIASLSRWTHVMHGLKMACLGAAMCGVLHKAFARLGNVMKIEESVVNAELEKAARIEADGGQPDDRWWKHCKRVLRVATFFTAAQKRWELAICLTTTAKIDKLQSALFGQSHRKCTLSDLVDPERSKIASVGDGLLALMSTWSPEFDGWRILTHIAGPAWHTDPSIMKFARYHLLILSSALFRRLEVRLAEYPYRLQWLVANSVPQAVRQRVAHDLYDRRECCLNVASRKLRDYFQTPARLLSDFGSASIRMLEEAMSFSNHAVEREHKKFGDHASSSTSGSSQGAAAVMSVSHQLRVQSMLHGYLDPSRLAMAAPLPAPLRDQQPNRPWCCDTKVLPQPSTASPAFQGRPAEGGDATSLRTMPAESSHGLALLDSLGGGNPQMMFVNFRLQRERQAGIARSNEEVQKRRTELIDMYNKSEAAQKVWKELFKQTRERRARSGDALVPVVAGDVAAPSSISPTLGVWQQQFQRPNHHTNAPIDPDIVLEHFHKHVKSLTALERMEVDIEGSCIVPKPSSVKVGKLDGGWGSVWGCRCSLHNVCRAQLRFGKRFEIIRVRLNRMLDERIASKETCDGDLVLAIIGKGTGRPTMFAYVALGQSVKSPKLQTFVRCSAASRPPNEAGFTEVEPFEGEWTLCLQTRPSRLNLPGSQRFMGLWFETSDELCERMSDLGDDMQWTAQPLIYHIKAGSSLLEMVVTGAQAEFSLQLPSKQRISAPDAYFAAMAMPPPGCPFEHGRGRSAQSSASTTVSSGAARPSARSAHALPSSSSGGSAPQLVEMDEGYDPGDDMRLEFHLEKLIDESGLFADIEEQQDGADVFEEGMGEQDAATLGDVGAEVMPDLPADDPAASSSNLAPAGGEIAAATPPVGEPDISITDDGYVSCQTAPHSGEVIGRITTANASWFVTCYVHAECKTARSVRRYTKEQVARWLSFGVPCPVPYGQPGRREAMERAARDHRLAWDALR